MSQTLSPDVVPVSPYEESALSKSSISTAEIRERIAEDLKDFGQVVSTSGTMLATRRHGLIFQDVTVSLRHPSIRLLLKVSVQRDPATGELSYYSEQGSRIAHSVTSYSGSSPLTGTEQAVVGAVMDRLRQHPVWSAWNEKMEQVDGNRKIDQVCGGALGVIFPMMVDGAFWDPFVGVTAGASVGMAALVVKGADANARRKKRDIARQSRELATQWNGDREATLKKIFQSEQEEAVFMDAFLSLCESAGIQYEGGLMVQTAPSANAALPVNLKEIFDARNTSPSWRHNPAMIGMIQLQGTAKGKAKGNLFFDGRRFYAYFIVGNNNVENTMVCPLA